MANIQVNQHIPKELLSLFPPPNAPEYRYYHCQLDWDGMKCKPVEGPKTGPENTKLLMVRSYLPESWDSEMLKHKWMPTKVTIEKDST